MMLFYKLWTMMLLYKLWTISNTNGVCCAAPDPANCKEYHMVSWELPRDVWSLISILHLPVCQQLVLAGKLVDICIYKQKINQISFSTWLYRNSWAVEILPSYLRRKSGSQSNEVTRKKQKVVKTWDRVYPKQFIASQNVATCHTPGASIAIP